MITTIKNVVFANDVSRIFQIKNSREEMKKMKWMIRLHVGMHSHHFHHYHHHHHHYHLSHHHHHHQYIRYRRRDH